MREGSYRRSLRYVVLVFLLLELLSSIFFMFLGEENVLSQVLNLYCIGDANGKLILSHAASAQGISAAAWEALMGLRMEAGQDVSSSMSPNGSVDLSIKDEDNNWSGQDHLQFRVNATKGFVTLLNGETSVSSRDFKSKMQTEHIELLQSPWLIELGAFHLNCDGSDIDEPVGFFKNGFLKNFSCDLTGTQQLMTMTISETMKYEYSLACPICLDTLFNPDALSCGHLFCKGCACGAASVYIFQGIRPAPPEANCPTCRTAGVFAHAVHMTEIDLLIKTRSKDY